MDEKQARSLLQAHGQEHVMRFWDELNEEQRSQLLHDVQEVDFPALTNYFLTAMESLQNSGEKVDDRMKPIPAEARGSFDSSDAEEVERLRRLGLQAVAEGRVGVLLLAGGQGTRLGVSHPKGMYNVGLLSSSPLYQLQAERILRLQQLADGGPKARIIWYIMTSEHTMAPTQKFFKEHSYFGLEEDQVVMFEQGTLPCLDMNGHVLLSNKHKLAKAPDGNGGLYRALKRCDILGDMKTRGIDMVHAYCVDNILVKMADPVFLGFCISKDADCGAKVVEKKLPTEAVGVVCEVDGKYHVVEYSEITDATAEMRCEDGSLVYSAANICNHFFTYNFLERIVSQHESELKHHVAKKKIPFIDEEGNQQTPATSNGVKLEKFVFDVFQFSKQLAVWDVRRREEFSPLKNADGAAKDTPTTSRNALFNLHANWVLAAGGKLQLQDGETLEQANGPRPKVEVEISPLVSYEGEGLSKIVGGKTLRVPLHIYLNNSEVIVAEGEQSKDQST